MKYDILERTSKEVEKIVRFQIEEVKKKGLTDSAINPRERFHLDSTKIAYHKDRVEAWQRGEKVAPITIDMALTQKCSYACTFCYAGLQQNPSSPVPWEVYENFLDDCKVIGHKSGENVKAISLVSDGESTENPDFLKFIRKAKANGIDIASGTNGLKLKKEELPEIVDSLTYLRFNFNAAYPSAYAEIMGTSERNFHKVVKNIETCVMLKKQRNSRVTIGLQMVLLPEYADQVIPLSLLGRELGVDYTVIKHCSDDEEGRLGIDYSWYQGELAEELLKTAEALSTPEHSVQAKWSKIKTGRDRKYTKCFGTALHLQMSGTGIVAPCGSFFHQKYNRYHIGDIKEKRFKDIWVSEKYWDVMRYLGSEEFNPQNQCATLCLQDKTNEVLFDLVERGIPLPDTRKNKQPEHMNFI